MGKINQYIATLAVAFMLLGCAPPVRDIRDLSVLPQDCRHYLSGPPPSSASVSLDAKEPGVMREKFASVYFAPWRRSEPVYSKSELKSDTQRTLKTPGYGENKKLQPRRWIESLILNADLSHYPNTREKGITVVNSALRLLPTHKPHFSRPDHPGSGYPFDNFQTSAIHANTPLFISHVSLDGAWFFVETHTGFGWVPARDVARVSEQITRMWETMPHVAVVKDGCAVRDMTGEFLFEADVGAQFPLECEALDSYVILTAVAGERKNAFVKKARLPMRFSMPKPAPLHEREIAAQANEFIGKPYGWGGLYGNRDCSSTLKDLFAPFDLWLPRHSSNQALEGGRYIDLSPLDPARKKATILEKGRPFFTLLVTKGHIMLYIGSHEGEPVVFHSVWGVRTRDFKGREGRNVIGRTVVTTLHPGSELPDFDPIEGDILNKIEAMTLLRSP